MQDCLSFTCCLTRALGLSLKCSQFKSFYNYSFGSCSYERLELIPLPYFRGSSTFYYDRLHEFFVTFLSCYENAYVKSFRLYISLPKECFPLTYDLNGFNCRTDRNLLSFCGLFLNRFLYAFNLFVCFQCFSSRSMPRSSCSVLHGANPFQ